MSISIFLSVLFLYQRHAAALVRWRFLPPSQAAITIWYALSISGLPSTVLANRLSL